MIIEYRTGTGRYDQPSRVLRTYKDVEDVETGRSGVTYLTGTTPAELNNNDGVFTRYAQKFLIAAIRLDEGEYLESVDVPRD